MTSTPCHHPQHLMENAGLRCQTNVNEAPDPQMLRGQVLQSPRAATDGPSSTKAGYSRQQQRKAYWQRSQDITRP